MIRVSTVDTFPLVVELKDSSDAPLSGRTVSYDIRYTNDVELSPPNNGVLSESTVASGIYKKDINISTAGTYVCYITSPGIPTITKDIIVDAESVADSVWSDTTAVNLLADIEFIKDVEGGRWKIINNQLIFYKDDNITQIAVFNLYDKNNNPAETNVYERVRL